MKYNEKIFYRKKGELSKSTHEAPRSINTTVIVHRPYGVKVRAKAAGRKGALHLSHNHLESNPPRPSPLS